MSDKCFLLLARTVLSAFTLLLHERLCAQVSANGFGPDGSSALYDGHVRLTRIKCWVYAV